MPAVIAGAVPWWPGAASCSAPGGSVPALCRGWPRRFGRCAGAPVRDGSALFGGPPEKPACAGACAQALLYLCGSMQTNAICAFGGLLASLNCALGAYFHVYSRCSWSENTRFAVFCSILQCFEESCNVKKRGLQWFAAVCCTPKLCQISVKIRESL